eukprot:1021783-Rhodomonas_salina.2
MSAHINDTLVLCSDLDNKFKAMLLARFDGTDEGEVETYLGCEIVWDHEAKTIQIRQSAYIQKILAAIHGMQDTNPSESRTPLEQGVLLTSRSIVLSWGISRFSCR